MLMPVDRTGENPLWSDPEPYYDDFYAIWDTYRTSTPLITLIDPQRETDIVRSPVSYTHLASNGLFKQTIITSITAIKAMMYLSSVMQIFC